MFCSFSVFWLLLYGKDGDSTLELIPGYITEHPHLDTLSFFFLMGIGFSFYNTFYLWKSNCFYILQTPKKCCMSSFESAPTVNLFFPEALPSVSQGLWCTSLAHIANLLPSDWQGHLLVTASCEEAVKTTYQGCFCHLGTIQQERLLVSICEFGS